MLILTYHSVNNGRKDDLAVTVENFKKQMRYFYEKGYRTVSLTQVIEKRNLAKRPLVITFDDGYRDNYTNVYSILKRYDFSAIIFLVTEYIGTKKLFKPEKHITRYGGREKSYHFLNWAEIREMSDNGIEFGSHSISHPHLTALTQEEIKREILDSKLKIETMIHKSVKFFSYPYGDFNGRIQKILKECGYKGAVVTPYGRLKEGRFSLRRVGIYRKDNMLRFRFKISTWFNILRRMRSVGIHKMQSL